MFKNKFSSIFYPIFFSAIALITVVLVVPFVVWAAKGATFENINFIDGEVLLSEDGVRNEYLVGQAVDGAGVSLKVGNKTFTTDELEFAVDNQSAGDKMVEVFHRDGNDYYRGYYLVTYFAVRHLDMRQAPTGIKFDADGNATVEGMVLWAELSSQPTSFVQPDEPGLDTVIILGEGDYTLEVAPQDENGGYSAKISCGKHSVNIYFIEAGGEMVILESSNRIAAFENINETDATLSLVITSRGGDDSANGKINVAEGFFVYTDSNGTVHKYQFDYFMSNQNWSSNFHSNDSAVSFIFEGDALMVTIDGVTFSTPRSSWCLAILDNPNP